MQLDHALHSSPDDDDDDEVSVSRPRSRPSAKTDQSASSSVLPSPVTSHPPLAKQRLLKPGPKRGSHPKASSARRASVTLKKEKDKKKSDSRSPTLVPDTEPDETNTTRCICAEDNDEANDVIMFQCDRCSVWQHGPCVGLYSEFPGEYFCEKCRPDLHSTGQFQKPSLSHRAKRSPSFTSSSVRRERVAADAASLAAFLTDAGVKPEDQLSLGGFALPVFAHTRRQSNMLADRSVPTTHKRQNIAEGSPVLTSGPLTGEPSTQASSELPKAKRKRTPDGSAEPPSLSEVELKVEEQLKKPKVSPASELPSPVVPPLMAVSKSASSVGQDTAPTTGGSTKAKRFQKGEDQEEGASCSTRGKASAMVSKNSVQASTLSCNRRGSPMKRSKEDGRRTKHVGEQELAAPEGWGLPDHLSYLDYLLPSAFPRAITMDDGRLEPATKVKFPSKRTTIADLKKRSKHLVDYLQKVQIESSDREKRKELIVKSLERSDGGGRGGVGAVGMEQGREKEEVGPQAQQVESAISMISMETLKTIDDLTRELFHWQEKYKAN